MKRTLKHIAGYSRIDGIVPGIKGQRAFPGFHLKMVDPFIMLDHIGPQYVGIDYHTDGEHSAHPHRGFETITFLFEGIMNHLDSLGNREILRSGSVQRMNAGKGIQHGGGFKADSTSGRFHEVQLWVNLPSTDKMSEPDVHNVAASEIPELKTVFGKLRIIAGEIAGQTGPIKTTVPIKVAHLIAPKQENLVIRNFSEEYELLVYVLEGKFTISGKEIDSYHSAILNNDGNELELEGEGQALILAGKPIQEPVVMGGPFVMNSKEEIDEAYADFNAGKFGTIR